MKNLLLFSFLFISSFSFAQDADKTVSITVSGSGKTQEEAKQSALRSAIFLTIGQQAATFSWQDKLTLSQIEQMTGYKVKPRGVVSQFKHGGFIVYEENGHGLVAAITDLGSMDWNTAKTACDELILNGYSDWHLPSKEELNALYVNLKQIGVGVCAYDYYWSSPEYKGPSAWVQNFNNGGQDFSYKSTRCNVRAVRSF
jgi:hypothetical protein